MYHPQVCVPSFPGGIPRNTLSKVWQIRLGGGGLVSIEAPDTQSKVWGRDVSFRSVHPSSSACPFMDRYSWSSVRVEPEQRLLSPEHKRDTHVKILVQIMKD